MATVTPEKITAQMKLNMGLSPTGATLTANVGLGSIEVTRFDADKALAIVQALNGVFTNNILSVERVETARLSTD